MGCPEKVKVRLFQAENEIRSLLSSSERDGEREPPWSRNQNRGGKGGDGAVGMEGKGEHLPETEEQGRLKMKYNLELGQTIGTYRCATSWDGIPE